MIKNSFLSKLLKSLKIFTKNLFSIKLIVQKLNKGNSLRLTNFQSKLFREIVLNLRYYFRFHYFKEMINILLIILKKKRSLNLLTEFIAFQLSILKKHNVFLRFLKQSLNSFIFSKVSCLKGLKLIFKGRINGVPRSSTRGFFLGKFPIQSYSENIYYSHFVSYTLNGTIGVKIWVFENL